MTQYLGICMVVVVVGLVIAVLAKLVTGGILEEIDKIRWKRAQRTAALLVSIMANSAEGVTKFVNAVKEGIELDEEYDKEKTEKASKEALTKLMKEMNEEMSKRVK